VAIAHRIYAEALFGAAKDAGRLAQVHEALSDFAAATVESPELGAVLRNPQLEPSAKAAILAEARMTRESMVQRMREETEAERQRRLEETRKEIAAETARALQQIRAEVADLTLEAASRVVGRTLDAKRDQELIEEAIAGLDFSRLEESA
jgi:F-type H+-transporting ATPase subunit b